MTTKKTLEQLQEDHSEMCATAADLGMKVPADLTVDFDTVEVGVTVVSNLDALIRAEQNKREKGLGDGAAKEVVATDENGGHTAPTKTTKSKKTSSTKATPAEASNSGEETVATAKKAKKPAAKKATAKKAKPAAKKAASSNGKASAFAEDAKISWGTGKKNPAREGAGRHERIEKVMKSSGKTVKAFIAGGGNSQTLRNCVKAKLCSVG